MKKFLLDEQDIRNIVWDIIAYFEESPLSERELFEVVCRNIKDKEIKNNKGE